MVNLSPCHTKTKTNIGDDIMELEDLGTIRRSWVGVEQDSLGGVAVEGERREGREQGVVVVVEEEEEGAVAVDVEEEEEVVVVGVEEPRRRQR